MEKHNPWWRGEEDEKYKEWVEKEIKWTPKQLAKIPLEPYSLHFLVGPRQVGKTTMLKLLIHRELKKGRNPRSIFYYQCDELTHFKELGETIDNYLKARTEWGVTSSLIVLDEITFVEEWWRALKSRIDLGMFKKDCLIISGSASIELLKEKERFPGRRGKGKDIFKFPLTFGEYLDVFGVSHKYSTSDTLSAMEKARNANVLYKDTITKYFENYLITGGFPLAIHDFYTSKGVSTETKRTYLDWIRGDMSRLGKSERYMKEILSYLIEAKGSPISWLSISKSTSIASPHTAESYVGTLESLFVVNILNLISPDFKIEYRKNKKIHFSDPFITSVFAEYTGKKIEESILLESVAASHISMKYPTYYWRDKSECDIVAVISKKQVGFEIKSEPKTWIKPRHLKEALLFTKDTLPLFLASLAM